MCRHCMHPEKEGRSSFRGAFTASTSSTEGWARELKKDRTMPWRSRACSIWDGDWNDRVEGVCPNIAERKGKPRPKGHPPMASMLGCFLPYFLVCGCFMLGEEAHQPSINKHLWFVVPLALQDQDLLKSCGLRVKEVEGDGACLFRACVCLGVGWEVGGIGSKDVNSELKWWSRHCQWTNVDWTYYIRLKSPGISRW